MREGFWFCGLTFELTGPLRWDGLARAGKMYPVPQAGPRQPAVVGPVVQRGVRPHSRRQAERWILTFHVKERLGFVTEVGVAAESLLDCGLKRLELVEVGAEGDFEISVVSHAFGCFLVHLYVDSIPM